MKGKAQTCKPARERSRLRKQGVFGLERSYSFSGGESVLAFEWACCYCHCW